MRVAYTAAQEDLRRELREYFAAMVTPELGAELAGGESTLKGKDGAYCRAIRQMGKDGWLGIGWPTQYGGQDRSMLEQLVFGDEATLAGVPIPLLTLNSVGPAIMEYGTSEQKDFFLPRILAGELHFSIGYSEPGAGTDLASLRTRADRDGDGWVINGQKMWTSVIQVADYVWLAARTDPDLPRHRGLSVFCVPVDTPGFSWTPVPTISGGITSQTFYTDVHVPAEALVGEVNGGWKLITGQLNHERVALCSAAGIQQLLLWTRRWAETTEAPEGCRVIDRALVRRNLGMVHAKVEFLKLINWKIAWGVDHGAQLGPAQASATKIFGTEFAVEAYRLLMECLEDEAVLVTGSPGAVLAGRLERAYRQILMLTFGGGTNEIQRDMIAMLGLGMPRPPR
ncbi:acyl-CoA dehydrogenase family protein [Pseudofrankia asymbiotica]|uniref:Acyl-CoA dehydrogenase n=1 Tax=Pseudofrankia asymbiotica TaxID=1834516 RepID=A0A1V2I8P6_9ACTN|nr:acyl-CoA dehydrogenase family protein [Pseudofrankia asymbiotica]ONH27122.1 acyl-CoA dehydrogenase [Pseudofrankia asymbiotica]